MTVMVSNPPNRYVTMAADASNAASDSSRKDYATPHRVEVCMSVPDYYLRDNADPHLAALVRSGSANLDIREFPHHVKENIARQLGIYIIESMPGQVVLERNPGCFELGIRYSVNIGQGWYSDSVPTVRPARDRDVPKERREGYKTQGREEVIKKADSIDWRSMGIDESTAKQVLSVAFGRSPAPDPERNTPKGRKVRI